MCRLIGYASPTPGTLSELIGAAQCSTFQNMSRLHADGWGTMWLDDDNRIASARITTPGVEDERLTSALSQTPARCRAVHLRLATGGMPVRLENCHPFVTDGIGFAHNGSILPVGPLRKHLPPDVLADVKGDTDSELYLALIRAGVRNGRSLPEACYQAVSWLRQIYPTASLNALVMSAAEFVAVHAGSFAQPPYDDFAASGLREDELPLDHLQAYYRLSYLRRADGAVAFSSTGIDQHGWCALPDESVTWVSLDTFELTTRKLNSQVTDTLVCA